jgi:Xaa-Pro dipeptidase
MTTRREFLEAATVTAAGGALLGRASLPGQDPLPPSIAALKSMKPEMRPITNEEREERLGRARRLMGERKIDALLLTGGTSLRYFTNIQWGLSERLFAAIVPATGRPFVVTPAFERDRAQEQIDAGPMKGAEVMTWEEDESPYRLIADGLKARSAAGTLGVEETVRHVFSDGVAALVPSARLVSGTPVTAGCRMVKSPAELALMRLASRVTLKAYAAAFRGLKDGMTQDQFADLVAKAHDRLGFTGGAGVQVGQFSALPHGSITPQVIKPGTILLIDGGCSVGGYQSDLSRTFVLGRATDRMKKVFDVELKAQTAAVKTARPGLECQAVDAAARKVIEDAGFGPGYAHFTHRVGHGMGMDGHEWPYLVKGNKLPLAAGMVFSDEPGIYLRGEFGVRLEDDMVITDQGAELFTPQSQSLEDPFAGVAA